MKFKGFIGFFRISIVLLCIMIAMLPVLKPSARAYEFNALVHEIDYLVIANATLARSVMPLVQYRRSQGLNAEIVNPEDIFRNYPGNTNADKLRNFLDSRYELLNLKYLLLVGSERTIPYKDLYPSFNRKESLTEVGKTWSNIYYSDLSSDYDSNRDGFAGEYLKDRGINFRPEVFVGRIPFDNVSDITNTVNNILSFERNPKSRMALLSASILAYRDEEMPDGRRARTKTDGATLTNALYRDLLLSYGYTSHRIYEKSGIAPSLYPADYSLRKLNFENLLINNAYDLVVWNGHGTHEALETKVWRADTNRNNRPDRNELVTSNVLDINSLKLSIKSRGIFITGSCSSLAPGRENLGTASLRAGFSAFIGGTSINWYSEGWRNIYDGGNQTIMYLVVRNLVLRNQTIGEALYHAIHETSTEFMTFGAKDYQNFYSFNLFGDPAMRLISQPFQDFSVEVDQTYKTINLGDSLNFDFEIHSDATQQFEIKAEPINYRTDLFNVFFYPNKVNGRGSIRMRIVMAHNIFPSNYTITIHFVSSGRSIFKRLNFLVLPWENNPHIYVNQPNTHVRRNSEFSLDFDIRKANNIDTVYIEVAYNNNLLSLNPGNIMIGPYLSQDGTQPKVHTDSDIPGVIAISCTRANLQRGISGDGLLFSLPFRALRDGTSNITIQRVFLFDPTGLQIPASVFHGRVQISSAGLHIDRNIVAGQTIQRRNFTLTGSSNANRLSLSHLHSTHYLEMDHRGHFQTEVYLPAHESSLLFFAQKGSSNFARLRVPVISSSFISILLRIGGSSAYVNGNTILLDAPPFIRGGRTMVPIRFISEAFGAGVQWNAQDQSVTIDLKDTRLTLWIGRTQAIIEKRGVRQNISLDVAPQIAQNRTFVPLRFVAEGFDAQIEWNAIYQLININYLQ